MCSNNDACSSLSEMLCRIVSLQKQGQCIDSGIQSCDRPYLGVNNNSVYNTRPVTFYTCPSNTLWTMPYTLDGVDGSSSVFRVETVEDCCCTCRVLAPGTDAGTYQGTDSFFTINLNCVGAIQCLDDTFIACI